MAIPTLADVFSGNLKQQQAAKQAAMQAAAAYQAQSESFNQAQIDQMEKDLEAVRAALDAIKEGNASPDQAQTLRATFKVWNGYNGVPMQTE